MATDRLQLGIPAVIGADGALEGRSAEGCLMDQQAEGEDVRAHVCEWVTRNLFRAHVERGPQPLDSLGEFAPDRRRTFEGPCDPEVNDAGMRAFGPALDEDVARFQVAVDDAGVVCGGKGIRDLDEDGEAFIRGGGSGPCLEVLPLDKLHEVVGSSRGASSGAEQTGNVGVGEQGKDAGFLFEAGETLPGGEVGVEELDRDPAESGIQLDRFVNVAEGTASETLSDLDTG